MKKLVITTLLILTPVTFALAATTHLNAFDTQMLQEMNQARIAAGLLPLAENAALDRAANDKVQDMLSYNYFSHTGSDGRSSWHLFVLEGYIYRYAAENLSKNFTDPNEAFNAYMSSPTHRKNIMNPKYTEVGLASQNTYEAIEFGKAR